MINIGVIDHGWGAAGGIHFIDIITTVNAYALTHRHRIGIGTIDAHAANLAIDNLDRDIDATRAAGKRPLGIISRV